MYIMHILQSWLLDVACVGRVVSAGELRRPLATCFDVSIE